MLEPELRHLLLEALRPPAGYAFDAAIGTTFTLDLVAMLLPAVAFARYDVEGEDGAPLANPVARLEAIRRHSRNITIFCQAGETRPPRTDLPALAFLEESVIPVASPREGGIFHPKVWAVRFAAPGERRRYRFLCLSRNLTLDRSWDTILRLDGESGEERQALNEPLVAFLRALPRMAVSPPPAARLRALAAFADEFGAVGWDGLHDGLQLERFWPTGIRGADTWPFPDDSRRMLVISPFVSPDAINRLTRPNRHDVLVSLPETLDALGQDSLKSVHGTYVMNADALSETRADESPEESSSRQNDPELSGLHAKLYVSDGPWWSRIWTGSANATGQAFSRNVEFLVELRGRSNRHGVGPLVEAAQNPISLGNLLMPYTPAEEPVPEPAAEESARALDSLAHELGRMTLLATVNEAGDGDFSIELEGRGRGPIRLDPSVELRVRPATFGEGLSVLSEVAGSTLRASFTTSFEALTAFFVFQLATAVGGTAVSKSFVLPAQLTGAPQDRLDRVLLSALKSRSDLMRLILLLLGVLDAGEGELEALLPGAKTPADGTDSIFGPGSLLEPLLRAVSRDHGRLEEIGRVVDQVARADLDRPPDQQVVPPDLPLILAVLREATHTAR